MFRAVVFRFAEIFGNIAAERFMHAELDGAAADAVDTECEIKNRTEQRHEPDDPDPDGGGAHVAFEQQGVNRGEQGGEKVEAGGKMRPEAGDFVEPVHCEKFYARQAVSCKRSWLWTKGDAPA